LCFSFQFVHNIESGLNDDDGLNDEPLILMISPDFNEHEKSVQSEKSA